jgi:alpha-beta hydrolase superfamily lysophospholipase
MSWWPVLLVEETGVLLMVNGLGDYFVDIDEIIDHHS